ncbi:MAG: hypothetical protein OEX07_12890, partial [Gammaproteobacteria bacterium]|nr:hypothetical protein [Gammaproteobacteria bacterium]
MHENMNMYKNMSIKKYLPVVFVLGSIAGMLGTFSATASADDAKARAIMEKVDARDDGDNQSS